MTNDEQRSQPLPKTEVHNLVRLNPDPTKYPSLHLSHCLLSPYYKREAITAMPEMDELDPSIRQYSTSWQVTVVLKKSFKPEITRDLLPLSLEMIQSNLPKLSYDNNDQPILIYSREVHVLSLSNDLLAMDHMQHLIFSVLHELRQSSEFFRIKSLTHLVLVLSFGWQLEFNAYITFDVDNNTYRIQFTPTLHELTQFIEYELNQYSRANKEGAAIGMVLLRILRLVCAPILEMKKTLYSNHRRIYWIFVPKNILHMQLFYINNKYEYSLTISKNAQMLIQENINASSRSHEPFKKQLMLANSSQSSIIKDSETIRREFTATIMQLNRYSISLEVFDKICEQFTTCATHVKRDGTNLTFSIRGTKYCVYIKDQDELCLSIDMDQSHSFTDEEAKYLSQVLFSKKIFYSILENGVNSSLPLAAFYSLFITNPNTNLMRQILQTLIAYQKESGSMDEEEYDNNFSINLIEFQEPTSSIMSTPSEEKKKRLLYCDILYYAPLEGLRFPRAISILEKVIGICVNCIVSTSKELFMVLRFQERDTPASFSQDTDLKFVDMPILINLETNAVSFDIFRDFKKSDIGTIGGSFLNKVLLQHTKSQIEENPLSLIVGQLCLLSLNELYNIE